MAAQDKTQRRQLTIDDLLALKSVAEPAISPDGLWVAYTVESSDEEADESTTQIFMVSRDGSEIVQLTADDYKASKPRWSPDGRYLGYLAAKEDEQDEPKTQVWTLDTRGGDGQAYTAVDQGVRDFRWAPDGKGMLLLVRDKSAADLESESAKAANREARPLPYVVDRLQFKQDGVPYLDRSRTHIYAIKGRGEVPLQLTFGDSARRAGDCFRQ
jgi:dipeptidyl aminopeptidase/acylaminoacyl peptidase